MEEDKALVDTSEIDGQLQELAQQVLTEQDPSKTGDLIDLFNWNISKKNVSRILKLNNLYDAVSDQMILRFATKSDQFTNSDLLDYLKAVQGAIDTSSKNLAQAEQPPLIVQNNNTQINVNVVDTFDADAKRRIYEAIQETLNAAKEVAPEPLEVEAEEVQDVIISEPVQVKTTDELAEEAIEEFNQQLQIVEGDNIETE